ncbi:MAG: hypothetical protein RL026_2003 [Pseudomonadota bacterium]|jgi:ABC-2 type transport system permease protein
MNIPAIKAIYRFEMARMFRTLVQSLAAPVLSTSLYFVVFGAAIGAGIQQVNGVSYGAFIVPGLIMLAVLTEGIGNASFAIHMPKWSGTIFELLSAPVGTPEIVLGYVGAATTKSVLLGLVILATSALFVPLQVAHPLWMLLMLVAVSFAFCLFGFLIGIWATSWERLTIIPSLVITPLTFLGGSFYSLDMLPPAFRALSWFNPVVYVIGGFRWAFHGHSEVSLWICALVVGGLMLGCLALLHHVLRKGYRLRH